MTLSAGESIRMADKGPAEDVGFDFEREYEGGVKATAVHRSQMQEIVAAWASSKPRWRL
jgi:hypothetical protein